MNADKIKTFATRILKECEREGFTTEEVLRLPRVLRFLVNDRMEEIRRMTKFSAPQAEQ